MTEPWARPTHLPSSRNSTSSSSVPWQGGQEGRCQLGLHLSADQAPLNPTTSGAPMDLPLSPPASCPAVMELGQIFPVLVPSASFCPQISDIRNISDNSEEGQGMDLSPSMQIPLHQNMSLSSPPLLHGAPLPGRAEILFPASPAPKDRSPFLHPFLYTSCRVNPGSCDTEP